MQRKWKRQWRRALARAIAPTAVAATLLFSIYNPVFASPNGGTVTSGSGSIANNGTTTTITQHSDKLAINWQSFDIARGETVNFLQPGVNSVALNRVIGNSGSAIYGALNANGKVFLINPNGILFAPGSQVNVGGLVASTLQLSDNDFLAGRYSFAGSGTGSVINQGTIRAADGGYVALLGNKAANEGVILANKGTVALAAGKETTLDFTGDGLINLTVNKGTLNAQASNSNLIQADGGLVVMTAKAAGDLTGTVVNNSGIIRAEGLVERNGKIVLDGGTSGVTQTTGMLDVSSTIGTGGSIVVTGSNVLIGDNAQVLAGGASGGGEIYIGGGWQGGGKIQHASATVVEANAMLDASATGKGNGGTVVIWSDKYSNFAGAITARGGANGGNGGRVETSSKGILLASGKVDASANNGNAGFWLLDPRNVTLKYSGAQSVPGSGGLFEAQSDSSEVDINSINAALDAGNDVTITTGGGGSQAGDITIAGPNVYFSSASGQTLKLQAAASIITSGVTIYNSKKVNLNFQADSDNDGIGGISLTNTVINTNGGNLTLSGENVAIAGTGNVLSTGGGTLNINGRSGGISIQNATLHTNGGNASITDDTAAVTWNASSLSTVGGDVQISGTRAVIDNTNIFSNGGNISITGSNGGIELRNNSWVYTQPELTNAGGSIILTGSGQNGINIDNSNVVTGNGAITMTGTGTGASNTDGIKLNNAYIFASSGPTATATLTGTVSATSGDNAGIAVAGNSKIRAAGDVTLTGRHYGSSGANNWGIDLGTDQVSVPASTISSLDGKVLVSGEGQAGSVRVNHISTVDNDVSVSSALDIALTGNINTGVVASGSDAAVTLRAGRSITLTDAAIGSTSGALDVTLSAGNNAAGSIKLLKDTIGSSVISNGGNIRLGGAITGATLSPLNCTSIGIHVKDSRLAAGSGNIELRSAGGTTGVALSDSHLSTTTGDIWIEGTSGTGVPSQGVSMQGGTSRNDMTITTEGGDITIKGRSLGGSDWANYGIWQVQSTIQATGNGSITMEGSGGPGGHVSRGQNMGIKMVSDSLVQTVNGDISITGTAGNSIAEGFNYGLWVGSSSVRSTGTGAINLQGTGGSGGNYNFGVVINKDGVKPNASLVETQSGSINITGTNGADGSDRRAIYVTNGTEIKSQSGAIVLTGNTTQGDAIVLRDSTYTSSISTGGAGTITLNGLGGTVKVGKLTTDKQAITIISDKDIILRDTINAGTTLDNSGGVITLRSNGGSVTDTAGITVAADGLVLAGAGASHTLIRLTISLTGWQPIPVALPIRSPAAYPLAVSARSTGLRRPDRLTLAHHRHQAARHCISMHQLRLPPIRQLHLGCVQAMT